MASLASPSDVPSTDLLSWLFANGEIDGSREVGISSDRDVPILTCSDIRRRIRRDTACDQRSSSVSHTPAYRWSTASGTGERRYSLFSRLQPCEYPNLRIPDLTNCSLGTVLNHLSWGDWCGWMFYGMQPKLHQH
jgi:hypothetical protein